MMHTHPPHHHHMQVSMHPQQIHPQQQAQQQQQQAPPHLAHQHLTNVPPPNVAQPPSHNPPLGHNMQREHPGNRIHSHQQQQQHHHPRVGGHQMQQHITIQQNPRNKLPHNGMVIGNMPPNQQQQQQHHQPQKPLPLSSANQPSSVAIISTQSIKPSHQQPLNVSTNATPVVSAITSTIITNKTNISNNNAINNTMLTQRIGQHLDNQPQTPIPTAGSTVAASATQADITSIVVSDSIPHDQQQILSPIETLANIKEKTPMCLVNELARYNKIQHQYRLTGETGPAHKKRFTVTLKLGDEEYTSEGASIKKAQHTAAHEAISKTKYKHPPAKTNRMVRTGNKASSGLIGNITPTVELNALAMKRGEPTVYETEAPIHANVGLGSVLNGTMNPLIPPPSSQQNGNYMSQHPNTHYGSYHRGNPNAYSAPPPRFGGYDRRHGGRGITGKPDYPQRNMNYYNFPPPGITIPEIYKVTLHVGERTFLGEGNTLQAARHDAAARALEVLKPLTPDSTTATECADTTIDTDDPNSELKSPISLVHEMALKRKLSVIFEVQSEKGPPHMKLFITLCKVGIIVTEGEGNGKKLSKKRAAEKMLDELKKLPPPSPEQSTRTLLKQKRRAPVVKKKTRNLIKEKPEPDFSEEVNPISRLMQIQQAKKEKEPVYTLIEERGVARRREFIIEVSAGGNSAIGAGPNKKIAKKVAAENLLNAIGYGKLPTANKENIASNANAPEVHEKPRKVTFVESSEAVSASPTNHGGSAGRQIVPGVLLMNAGGNKPVGLSAASTKSGINLQQTATIAQELLSEGTSPTADAITKTTTQATSSPPGTPAAPSAGGGGGDGGRIKEQLMYLAQLLNFDVMFSDFPKGNHGEFLTLVTLSTDPPQLCHGSGSSLDESHDEAARGALEMLSKIGLDNVKSKSKTSDDNSKPKTILTNGVKK